MIHYRHFIWDFDGMLVDSYPHTTCAAMKTLRDFGIEADAGTVYWDLRISIRYMQEKYAFTPEMIKVFKAYEETIDMEPIAVPYHGIPELLREIKTAGGKNYLFTNRNEYAGIYLEKYGMIDNFEEIVDSTYGFPSKPHPAGMLYLADRYGMKGNSLMLGDRELDITAGLGGGADGCLFDQFNRIEKTQARYTVHTIRQLRELLLRG